MTSSRVTLDASSDEGENEQTRFHDIEHIPVHDDPRAWSYARKIRTLAIISSATLIVGLAATCQNPANAQIERDLHGSSSWSMAVFILLQGISPIVWSTISEIKGRKTIYLSSLSLFTVGSALVATSNSITVFTGMRGLQAIGSGAVLAIGAGTLADIYEPHERGTKLGIYYAALPFGASMGPFLGGTFTQAFGWRAVFWFVSAVGGVILLLLSLFEDSFRKKRSLLYKNALKRRLNVSRLSMAQDRAVGISEYGTIQPNHSLDLEDINLSFTDVNPFSSVTSVLKQRNNAVMLMASGLIFSFTYSLTYTTTRTLSTSYGYDALNTGFVLLSSGVGSICGIILGGRWSDAKLKMMQEEGIYKPEIRLQSTLPAMPFLLLSTVGYAWMSQTHQSVATISITLFIITFASTWIYSSTLAYIVDANKGRPSTAVAVNSMYRGILACIATIIAVPLQDSLHDGGIYTLWAGLLLIMEILILLVLVFGKQWREKWEEAENSGRNGK